MTKPDWKDAPKWARWLAQDEDGEWYWYERRPDEEDVIWAVDDGKFSTAGCGPQNPNWRDTLEKRPVSYVDDWYRQEAAQDALNARIADDLMDEDVLGDLLPEVYTEFELTEAARCIMANDPQGLMDFFRTSLTELARRKHNNGRKAFFYG